MKKFLKTTPEKCIACHVCESTCSNLYFKTDDAELSCIRITETEDLPHMNVCNQCEACVKVCPTKALTVSPQGVVLVNKKLCISCYMCIAACPTGSMFRALGGVYPFKCIACGACVKTCPADAISIVQE